MIDPTLPVTEDELHAYVDGELPADRVAAIESWLAVHPEDMARVAAWRAQKEAIRARYAAVAHEPVPARFDLDRLAGPDQRWRRVAAAAVLAAFICGGGAGWFAHRAIISTPGPQFGATRADGDGFAAFTAEAIAAYKLYTVEVRHPVEVAANDAEHLTQWLSKRLGYQLRAPQLESVGLNLVGGRLLPGPTGAAAFLMYENAAGERYTLYCGRTRAPATALRYNESAAASAVYWASDDVAYVISGKSERTRLHDVAVAVHAQLEAHAGKQDGG